MLLSVKQQRRLGHPSPWSWDSDVVTPAMDAEEEQISARALRPKWPVLPVLDRGGRCPRFGSALAPFSLFDRLFLDGVVLVEADESFDVVAGGDAFLGAEAGKVTARLELSQGLARSSSNPSIRDLLYGDGPSSRLRPVGGVGRISCYFSYFAT